MATNTAPEWAKDPTYQSLRERLSKEGAFEKTPTLYVGLFCTLVLITLAVFYVLPVIDNNAILFLVAVLFAFPRLWFGYLGHDLAHGAVFSSRRIGYILSILVWPLSLGVSGSYWYYKHNKHHEYVNKIGSDPDLDLPVYLSNQQRKHKNYLQKMLPDTIVRHQHRYFFFLFPLSFITFVKHTYTHLLSAPHTKQKLLELFLVTGHFVAFYGLIFWILGFWQGLLFSAVNVASLATIMAFAFAPNHKGEEMFEPDEVITWRHQVIGTRNIRPSLVVDFLYGGLNYQIEHHLFPYLSRFKLPQARLLVKDFCKENGVRYHETTPFGSVREIYCALETQSRNF